MSTAVVLLRAVLDREAPQAERHFLLDTASMVALGQALTWRKAIVGSRLIGLAAGPPEWETALREAIALGVDEMRRVWSAATSENDVVATARNLATGLPANADLVFAGPVASDNGSGALPGAIAPALGWPLLSEITAVEMRDGVVHAKVREKASRRTTYRIDGPAVLVAAQLPPPPLYPPLARRLQARNAVISETAPPEATTRSRVSIAGYGPARPRVRHLLQPQASANAGDRLRSLMGGGMAARSSAGSAMKADDDSSVAKQLVQLLAGEGLLEQL